MRALGQRRERVHAELLGHGAAHLGCDVWVAVAVRSDPAAGVEEGGTHRRHAAGLLAQLPVVEPTVDLGHHVEEGGVEEVEDRVGFLDGRGLLERDGRGAEERLDLLQHLALVLEQVGAAQARPLVEQGRDAADLALDRLAARLGRVGREDGVELQAPQQPVGLLLPAFQRELAIGHRHLVHGVGILQGRDLRLALLERVDAVVLLADVGAMEEGGEGAHEQGRLVGGQGVDDADGVVEHRTEPRFVQVVALEVRLVGQQSVEGLTQLGVVLLDDLLDQTEKK